MPQRHRSRGARKNPFVSPRRDAARRAQFLRRIGIYKPTKSVSFKNITKSQIKRTNKLFDELQKHAIYKHGKVIRPAYQNPQGYHLRQEFHATRQKLKRDSATAFRTRLGSIIISNSKKKPRVRKDGSIETFERQTNGKLRKVTSGLLNGQQVIDFFNAVDSNIYKLPKGKKLTMYLFGNALSKVEVFSNKGLKSAISLYSPTLTNWIDKHPDTELSPLEISIENI